MLYLIEPDGGMKWSNLPAQQVLTAARESDADLSLLDWEASERTLDEDTLRVALRHGVPCTAGLVIEAGLVGEQGQAEHIRETHRDAQRAHAALQTQDALMENLLPGWTESGRELNARVDEGSESAAREAEGRAARRLNTSPDPALIDHWTSLGGELPATP